VCEQQSDDTRQLSAIADDVRLEKVQSGCMANLVEELQVAYFSWTEDGGTTEKGMTSHGLFGVLAFLVGAELEYEVRYTGTEARIAKMPYHE
jgi:hypothetical protein